jgi:hypothetical protein
LKKSPFVSGPKISASQRRFWNFWPKGVANFRLSHPEATVSQGEQI